MPSPEHIAEAAAPSFEITFSRNLVPARPGRRYERKAKRPGGRYKIRKPGQGARLTQLTIIAFWLTPARLNLIPLRPALLRM